MSAVDTVTLVGSPRSGRLRWLRRATVLRTSGLLVATIALLIVCEMRDSHYLAVGNLQVLGIQMSQVGIAAVLEKPLSDSALIECIRRTT